MSATFEPHEVGIALLASVGVQAVAVAFMMLWPNEVVITPQEEELNKPVPMAVKPVLDMAPLLKLGSKTVAKLPDMWVKQKPIKRVKKTSAPSPDAEKTVDAIPTSELAKLDASAPPPDAETAKEVDEDIEKMDASPEIDDPNLAEKGSADGVKEGTETDPVKARAISQYRMRIIRWFSSRFRVPSGTIPCEELEGLSAAVAANVSGDGTVTSYSLSRPSGNGTFDARVRATMDSAVGQQLPPPPQNYPDSLDPVVYPTFLGRGQKCE